MVGKFHLYLFHFSLLKLLVTVLCFFVCLESKQKLKNGKTVESPAENLCVITFRQKQKHLDKQIEMR